MGPNSPNYKRNFKKKNFEETRVTETNQKKKNSDIEPIKEIKYQKQVNKDENLGKENKKVNLNTPNNSKNSKHKSTLETKDDNLSIPDIPMKKAIKINPKDLKNQTLGEPESQDPDIKTILIECKLCGHPIKMPVPKILIIESDLPVTEVTYVHSEPPHAVTAYLDKAFAVRRRRTSFVVFQKKYEKSGKSVKK